MFEYMVGIQENGNEIMLGSLDECSTEELGDRVIAHNVVEVKPAKFVVVRTVLDDEGNTVYDADEFYSVDLDKAKDYVSKAAERIETHVRVRPNGRMVSTTRADKTIERVWIADN